MLSDADVGDLIRLFYAHAVAEQAQEPRLQRSLKLYE